jgi:hypothetical protein
MHVLRCRCWEVLVCRPRCVGLGVSVCSAEHPLVKPRIHHLLLGSVLLISHDAVDLVLGAVP